MRGSKSRVRLGIKFLVFGPGLGIMNMSQSFLVHEYQNTGKIFGITIIALDGFHAVDFSVFTIALFLI